MKTFFHWLGRILSDESHPFTRSMADCMRYLVIAGLSVVSIGAAMAMGFFAADDYGNVEKLADVAKVVVGAGAGAGILKGLKG